MNGNSLRKEIVDKADIVNIISQYVKLEKRGNNYFGICPFHDDKNPSMSVNQQKKVFKCFSCGTAGDVVSFVSKIKKTSSIYLCCINKQNIKVYSHIIQIKDLYDDALDDQSMINKIMEN